MAQQTPYKITIITVVRNGAATIQHLINSVAKYKTPHVEFFVWDGQSTDHTVEILKANSNVVDNFVSLPDTGIYDAMNKAVKHAKGKFILFMGADDQLLEGFPKIVPLLHDEHTIYYGGVIFGRVPVSHPFTAYQLTKANICHQAVIYPAAVFEKYTYNTSYKVFADYHLNIRCWTDPSFKQQFYNLIISEFTPGGFSDLTRDLNYTRDKEKWFKTFLPVKDYYRYVKRKAGLKGMLKELITGSKVTAVPKKNSTKHSILLVNNQATSTDKPELKNKIKALLDLGFELTLLTDATQINASAIAELAAMDIKLISTKASHFKSSISEQIGQIEYLWVYGMPEPDNYVNAVKSWRYIKIVFDMAETPITANTLKAARRSDATLAPNAGKKEQLEKQAVFNVYQNDGNELIPLFNSLR